MVSISDPSTLIMLVIFAGLPSLSPSLSLYVVSTKVITHFNDIMTRDSRCTDRRPRNQNKKRCCEVTSSALPDTSPLSDITRVVFQLKNILYLALTVIKVFWRSLNNKYRNKYTYLFLVTEN